MSTASPTAHTTAHAPDRTAPPTYRSAGVAGLLSVGAMVTAFIMLPADSGGSAPHAIARRYAEGADGYLRAAVLETASVALLVVLLAGLALRLRNRARAELAAGVTALGGTMLASCQLVGYGLIAVLALGTAERSNTSTLMAFYDASAVAFVVSSAGLALTGLATGCSLLQRPARQVGFGSISVLAGLAGVVGTSALAAEGALSAHGDVSFLVLLIQLIWTLAAALWLLRPDPAPTD
jgi:hypothetical protein